MRRPVIMLTNIVASPETSNIHNSTSRDPGGQGQGHYPHFTKVIGPYSSVNVTRTFVEKPCMCDSPRSVTFIHPRIIQIGYDVT